MNLYASYKPNRNGGMITIEKDGETDVTKGMLVPVTLDEAKQAWNDGKVSNCNLTFERLARNDFDIEETCEFYRNN